MKEREKVREGGGQKKIGRQTEGVCVGMINGGYIHVAGKEETKRERQRG